MNRFIISILLISLFTCCISAQEGKLTAAASPSAMRVGDQFNLIYTSDQEVTELALPAIDMAEVLGGPSQGHSQSVYSVNGKVTTSSTYQYTYFLRALKEGKFTIPAASGKIKNKLCRSNPVNIEVIASRNQPSKSTPGSSGNAQVQNGTVNDRDVFINLILDKKNVYLGEQILATIKVYTKVNLSGVDQGFKGPDFTGFFTEPLEVPPLRNLQREVINGDIYYTGVLRKILIIPQKTGELTIQPFDLDVAVRQEVHRRIADPFFDNFDIPDVQEIPLKLSSKAVSVEVKPLPAGPPSFGGAVGNFTFSSSLNKVKTTTNDPLTLKLTITGKGNIKLINELNVNAPPDFEKYDPVINTHADNSLSGNKTFEYLLVPRSAGTYTIFPVEFTYFDPVSVQYKTLKSQAYTVEVEKGKGDSLVAAIPGISKEDIKLINRDIRFIKTKPSRLRSSKSFWGDSPWYYLTYAVLIGVFFLLTGIQRNIVRNKADIAGIRLRKADRYAQKRLKKSAWLLKQGESSQFYEELLGAIWGYLSDKLNIPLSVLSQETAKSALFARSVDPELVDALFSVTDECEMARYAQVTGNLGMEKTYQDALQVITALQQRLK